MGKAEAISQHHHRGQHTLRHKMTQAWGAVKDLIPEGDKSQLPVTIAEGDRIHGSCAALALHDIATTNINVES